MKRGTLVCMTGLDGAGKSTLTNNVVDRLQAQGYDAVQVYGRYLPKLTYPLIVVGRQTVFSSSDIEDDYEDHQSEKENVFSNKRLAKAYEGVVMADYIPQFIWRVLRQLYTHDLVICDRYVYDTLLTDLAGDVLDTPQEAIDRYRMYSHVFPDPEYEFYVRVPPEVSMERKDDVPSIEYLRDRRSFYDAFADAYDLSVLDGTESIDYLTGVVVGAITEQRR